MSDRKPSSTTFAPVRPCTVGIHTKTGGRYEFPEMDKIEVFKVLGPQLYGTDDLVLTNLSGATLTIPVRSIDSIAIDGEVSWRASSTP